MRVFLSVLAVSLLASVEAISMSTSSATQTQAEGKNLTLLTHLRFQVISSIVQKRVLWRAKIAPAPLEAPSGMVIMANGLH